MDEFGEGLAVAGVHGLDGVGEDEWARRTPLLDRIREAIRAARNAAPA